MNKPLSVLKKGDLIFLIQRIEQDVAIPTLILDRNDSLSSDKGYRVFLYFQGSLGNIFCKIRNIEND